MSAGFRDNVVGEAVYNMTVDDAGLHDGLRRADASAQQLGNSFNRLSSIGVGAFAGIATAITNMGIGALVSGIGSFKDAIIGMNATLETSQLQFETLFGSAERAEEHVANLFEFAKLTPFDTGPIIEASRLLQTFGGDALNTMEYLTLLGDASAAVSQEFDQVSLWIGRAYSAIQGGQPFGMAAARLQEMALLTPQARMEMEELQSAGASADEVFAVLERDLARFSGSMSKMANTWEGAVGTFADSAQILLATAFRPIFEALRDGLNAINAFLEAPAVENMAVMFGDIMAGGIRRLVAGIGFLVTILRGPLAAAFVAVRDGVITFVQALQGNWVADDRITNFHLVIGRIGTALSIIVGPLQRVIAFLASLGRYFAAVATDGDTLNDWLTHLPAGIQPIVEAFGRVVAHFGDFLTVANPVVSILRQLAVAFGRGGLSGAIEAFPGILNNVIGSFRNVAGIILNIYQTLIPAIVNSLRSVDWAGVAADLYNVARDNLTGIDWGGIAALILSALSAGLSAAGSLVTALSNQLASIDWDAVGATITGGITAALGAAAGIGAALFDAFSGVDWGAVGDTILSALGTALSGAAALGSTLIGLIADGVESVAGFAGRVGGWIIEQLSGVDYLALGSDILGWIVDGALAVADVGMRLGGRFLEWVGEIDWAAIGSTVLDGVLGAVFAVADVAIRLATWLYDTFTAVEWSTIGSAVVSGIVTAITAVADTAMRIGAWLLTTFTSVDWSGIGSAIADGIAGALELITDFGTRIVGWIQTQLTNADFSGIAQTVSGGIMGGLTALGDSGGSIGSIANTITNVLAPALSVVADEILPRLMPAWKSLAGMFVEVAETISTRMGPTLDQLSQTFNALKPILQVVGTIIGAVVIVAFNALAEILSRILPRAVNTAITIINALLRIIEGIAKVVTGVVQIIAGLITGDFNRIWEGARNIVSGVVDAIAGLLRGLGGILSGIFGGLWDIIIGFFTGIYNALVGNSIVPDTINGIVTAFGRLITEIPGILGNFVASVLGFFGDLLVEGVRLAVDLVTGVVAQYIDLWVKGPKWIYDTYTAILGYLADLVTDGIKKVVEFVTGVLDEVAALPGKALEAIGDLSKTLWNAGVSLIEGLWGGLKEKWEDVKGWFGGITDAIPNLKGPPAKDRKLLYPAGGHVIQGFNEGMASEFDASRRLLSDFTDDIANIGAAAIDPDMILDATPYAEAAASLDIATPTQTVVDKVTDAGDSVRRAFDGLAAAMDFIDQAAAVRGINSERLRGLVDDLAAFARYALSAMGGVAAGMSGEFLESANATAGAITSALGAIGGALTFAADATTTGVLDFGVLAGLVDGLVGLAAHAVRSIGDAAAAFSGEFLEQSGNLTGAVGASMGILQQGLDFVVAAQGIGDRTNFDSVRELASNLKHLVEHIVVSIGDSAAYLAMTRGEDFLEMATAYADNSRSAMSALTEGVALVRAMEGLTVDLSAATQAASDIKFLIEHIVLSVGDSAALVASTRPDGFLGAADLFADSAENATGAMMRAVEFIGSLADIIGKFDLTATMDMASALKFLIEHIALSIGDSAQYLASIRAGDFLSGMTRYVEAVGPAIDMLANVATLLQAPGLNEIVARMDLFKVTIQNLVSIARSIADAVTDAAAEWGTSVNPRLTTFVDEVGQSFAALTQAADFAQMAAALRSRANGTLLFTIEAIGEAVGQLIIVARTVADTVEAASASWREEVNPRLTTFAADVETSMGVMMGTIAFIQEAASNRLTLAPDAARNLASALTAIATTVAEAVSAASADWNTTANPALEAFAADVGAGMSVLNNVMGFIRDGIGIFADEKNTRWNVLIGRLVNIVEMVVKAVQRAADKFNTDGLEALRNFSEGAGYGLALMQNAVDLIAALTDMNKLTPRHIDLFVANWELVISGVERLARLIETRGLNVAQKVLKDVEAMADVLTRAMELMNKISGDYLAAQNIKTPSVKSPASSPTASTSAGVIGGVPTRGAPDGAFVRGDIITNVNLEGEPVRRIVRGIFNDTVRETI